jgi:deoxycytidylate deaminase
MKDSGQDVSEELSPTLRAMPHSGSHANGGGQVAVAFAIQERAVCENPDAGPGGAGFRADGAAYTLEARTVPQAVAFAQNQRDEVRQMDVAGALASEPGMKQQTYVAAFEPGSIARNAGPSGESHLALTLRKEMGDNQPALRIGMQVRRLTPRECERLQGFPDDYTLIPTKVKRLSPPGSGPCAKQTVIATIVAENGTHFVATNHCLAPQLTCARAGMPTGVGYDLCKSVCRQPAHAEINAVKFAGRHARGGTLYLEGHTYACDDCTAAVQAAGVTTVVLGKPPGNAADGPRYKALGNSWAVPVVRWIADRIERELL